MISLNIRTFASTLLAALALAGPAAAELPVTTSETDSGLPNEYVVIVDPDDGAVLPGSPDAVVQVVIEYEIYLAEPPTLRMDGDTEPLGDCYDKPSPCTVEATIPAGVHTLSASIGVDEHTIAIEVQPTNDTTGGETDSSGSSSDGPTSSGSSGATTGDPGTSGSSGSSGSDSGSTTSDGAATSGGGDGDKGCACSTAGGAPDVLGLALAALALPWRRRRHR